MALGLVKGDFAARAKEWREVEAENEAAAKAIENGEKMSEFTPSEQLRVKNNLLQIAKGAREFAEMYENASAA